jgi:hypothetical protein
MPRTIAVMSDSYIPGRFLNSHFFPAGKTGDSGTLVLLMTGLAMRLELLE